jgi:hypothetical protein
VAALVSDPQNAGRLYAGTGNRGIYKSSDSGANWNIANSGFVATYVSALAIDPQNAGLIYAGTANGAFTSIN